MQRQKDGSFGEELQQCHGKARVGWKQEGQVEHVSRRYSVGRNHFPCAFSPDAFISNPAPGTSWNSHQHFLPAFSNSLLLNLLLAAFCILVLSLLWKLFSAKCVPLVTPSSSVLFPFLRLPFFCVQRLVSWNTFPSFFFFPKFLSVQFHSILG